MPAALRCRRRAAFGRLHNHLAGKREALETLGTVQCDRDILQLRTRFARRIELGLDLTRFAWRNRILRPIQSRAAARWLHILQNQRILARVGEFEFVFHDVALVDLAEVEGNFLKLNGREFFRNGLTRDGVDHHARGQFRGGCHHWG